MGNGKAIGSATLGGPTGGVGGQVSGAIGSAALGGLTGGVGGLVSGAIVYCNV